MPPRRRGRPASIGHPTRSCAGGDRSRSGPPAGVLSGSLCPRRRGGTTRTFRTLAGDERAELAHEQFEMLALLVGELEEDALALRLLEPLAVLLEEPVRGALAPDPDAQRLLVIDAGRAQFLDTGGKQAIRRALEEEKRRLRLELRFGRRQLAIARLERAQ